jgi:hypothetical protein
LQVSFMKIPFYMNIACKRNSGLPHWRFARTCTWPDNPVRHGKFKDRAMKTLSKAMVGTLAAGAMAAASATPAAARDNDGVDAGDVIAGALIIGGIAAVAAAASDKNKDRYGYNDRNRGDYRYDRAGYRDRYGQRAGSRQAVQQCVRATERRASRYSYGRADVTEIRRVRETRRGYEVRGRVVVDSHRRGYDRGKFTCKIRYGRVADIDFSGIRGLR